MDGLAEIIETQNEVIRKEAKIIDELFRMLLQHIEVEELCSMQAYADIQDVAAGIKKLE
ncbi:MAG: hypothetical protein IJL07_08940 [Lachnospiraceae bacterium]|nr:hypothetical protein [Lachnospiraceae bacterium]